MSSLLTPQEVRDVSQPATTGWCLPPRAFTSDAFFEEEQQRVFRSDWIAVGRADRVANPGDYFTLRIGRDPLIITRDSTGRVRAFANACPHRGSLIAEGAGNVKSFVCPYHGWSFDPDGKMVGAPLMNRTEGFDRKDCALGELQVEIWEGFAFVHFDPDAPPLAPRLAGLSEKIARYRFAEMRADDTIELENACNWKIGVENAIDEYHAFIVHASLTPTKFYHLNDTFAVPDPDGAWVMNCTPAIRPHPYTTGTAAEQSPFPAVPGLDSFEMQSFNVLGVFPNMVIALNADSLITLLFFPLAADRCAIHLAMNYPVSTFALPDFAELAAGAREALVETNEQDMYGCRMAQDGLYSSKLGAGRLSYLEEAVTHFDAYVARRMAADTGSAEHLP